MDKLSDGKQDIETSHCLEPLPGIQNASLLQALHPHLVPFPLWATGIPCEVVRWLASVEKLSLG